MSPSTNLVPEGSIVLVTGVSGFIGAHVADQLLKAGYRVRGTVRSPKKAAFLFERFAKYGKDKFETVAVPDMNADGAYTEAVKGVTGIIHLASVTTFSSVPEEVIPPAVKGATNIVEAAKQESSVKSIVLTSSTVALGTHKENKAFVVTEQSYNSEAVAEAKSNPNGSNVYAASKTEAERAFWEAVQEAPFQASAVLPSANFGANLSGTQAVTDSWLPKLWEGTTENIFPVSWHVNVVDSARLHVAALIDPSANGRRLAGISGPYNLNDLLASLRRVYPERKFIEDVQGLGKNEVQAQSRDDAEALLIKHYGAGFVGLDQSVKENIDSYLENKS